MSVLTFFLNIGLAIATLAESENEFVINDINIESVILTASFTILTGILWGPIGFYSFIRCLIILLISMAVAGSMVKSLSSERTLSLINLILLYILITSSITSLS